MLQPGFQFRPRELHRPGGLQARSHLTRVLGGMVTDIANGIVRRRDRALADSCVSAPSFSK